MLTKQQKIELLENLKNDISNPAIVFVNYRGLKVAEISDLRGQLHAAGMGLTVSKNTLLRRALSDAGVEVPAEILDEPLAYVKGAEDEVSVSKLVNTFGTSHENIEIMGGLVGGQFVTADQVKYLATLPGRDELYAKVVGSIAAPLSGMVAVLGGNLRGLVSVLKQYQSNK